MQEADRQREAKAFHLEAEALEKALALLPARHPERAKLARRLAEVYRGSLWQFERARFWIQTIAEELRPTPEGIDALFDLADTLFNHGRTDEALKIYREILKRIVPPQPPYDVDNRAWKGWHGEELCKFPMGGDPLFPSDLAVAGKLGRLSQLVQARDWRGVRALLDQNLPLQWTVQQPAGTGPFISLRRWVRDALSALPAETAAALAVSYDPVLSELAAQEDRPLTEPRESVKGWRAIAAFRMTHPLAELERKADALTGDKLLEAGLPALASLYYGGARGFTGSAPPELLAREVFSRIEAGQTVGPETVPDVAVEVGGQRRSLREWTASWQPLPATAPAPSSSLDLGSAVVTRLPVIRAPLPLREWQLRWQAREVIEDDVPPFAEEFVPMIPAGSSRCLVVNMGDAIEVVDLVDGRLLWTFLPPEQNAMTFPSQKYEPDKAFIECARARTAVVAGDRVYCHLAWGHHDTYRHAGGLFALDRTDGRLLWSSLQLPELAETMIAGDPAVERGVVVALAWRPREALPLFFVVGLSAETGELLWMNHLYSGASVTTYDNHLLLDRPLAAGAPAIADGVAYLATGAGVVAAVDIMDGTTVWATTYPRIKSVNRSKWASRKAVSRPAGIVAVFEDTVLFAPADADAILAVDRAAGRVRYSQESADLKAIAASDGERAYIVEGTAIRAMRPGDGKTLWRRPLPVSGLVGLPTLGPRGLMCPSWEGLHVLDAASGEVREQRKWNRDEACSYLLDFGDRLAGTSRIGLNVLAAGKLDDTDPRWLSAEAPTGPVEVRVAARSDKWLRWGLPALDRGDFVLSDADPDHLLIRSELLQMRDMEPVPTLRWQRQSPLPWDCEAVFNSQWVAVWNVSDVYVMDAATGRAAWEDHPLGRMGRPISRVSLVDKQVRVHLGWKQGRVLSQTAPTIILFDGTATREIPPAEVPLLPGSPTVAKAPPGDVRYEFSGRRIRAVGADNGEQLWQTATLLDEVRLLTEMGGCVVALTQDRVFREGHDRGTCHLRVFDKSSGDKVKDIAFPKRYFHTVAERNGRLLLWDCAFLYCVKAPELAATGEGSMVIRQERADPDAIAALRMARDLEDPPPVKIATLAAGPCVNGDLAEWAAVEPLRLGDVMDWAPDFAHRSPNKGRLYGGRQDCAAEVRLGFFGNDLYAAIEVSDDSHVGQPGPGLWQSDSVTLLFGEAGGDRRDEVDPLMLTVAVVDGLPRFELGTAVSASAVSDPAGREAAEGPGPRRFVLPPVHAGLIVLPRATESIEIAARREDALGRTVYEFRVPRALFPYGPGFYWDLFINDNDGAGREGALQLASATWGIEETQIGGLRGVGERPGPLDQPDSRQKRRRAASATRPTQ